MSITRFTLIHGTFAARSQWLNDDDDPKGFRARLKARFKHQIEYSIPTPWGSCGRIKWRDLTNAARLNGAQTLKQHVLQEDDVERHFMVAHSHGGNVAMYALQDPAVAAKVDGLICMATPFLYPRKRPLSIMALTISLGIMLTGMLQLVWAADMLQRSWWSWIGALSLLLFTVVVPAILTWLVAYERYQYKVKHDSRLRRLIDQLSYQNPDIPILLVRASGDEATGLLRGAQFLNWLGGIGMRIGGRQLYVFICAGVLALAFMAYRGSSMMPSFVLPLLNQGLMISASAMVLLLMALTVSRVFVGFDAWRWVGEIETMVEDGPPGIPSELVVILPRTDNGLSHTGIYTDPETIDSIASWCEGVMQNNEANLPR